MSILLNLFFTFFRIGLFTFGGGYAMLPLIQQAVLANEWLSPEELIDFIAVSESTPGPFAVNIATYVGTEQLDGALGLVGGLFATLGVVMPSFIVILIVAKIFDAFKKNKIVKACMYGLKAAVPGLIASAFLSMAETVFVPLGFDAFSFKDISIYISLAISILSLLLIFKKKLHPIIVICISAVIGIAAGYIFNLPI